MTWIDIGTLKGDSREWQLSQPITGNLFKIINEVSAFPTNSLNYTGLIGINYGFEDFLEVKQFFSTPKSQLFLFPNLNFDSNKYLAIRNISRTIAPNSWLIRAYVWDQIIDDQLNNETMEFAPSPYSGNYNNLGYQKITQTIEQFSQKPAYDSGDIFWVQPTNINGTISYNPDSSQRVLEIGTNAADKLITQTKESFVYLAGNVHRFSAGLQYQCPDGGVIEFGLFDDNNGAFFRIKGTATGHEIEAVRRSNATGTVIDEAIPQSQWNIDKLDGTGKSGIILDLDKVQMFSIEFSWYGVGGVAYGLEIDRQRIICHWSSAGNRLNEFVFGDPDLPCRYALYNTKITDTNTVAKIGGIFVGIDGGIDQRKGFNRGWVRPLLSVQQNNSYVLANLRPALTYKGKINRAYARLEDFFVYGSANGTYTLEFLPQLTAPNWQPINNATSMMEYDIDATSAVNGVILYCGAISSQKESDKKEILLSKDPLTAFSDGSGSNHLSILFKCTTGGSIGCGFNWSEYY